jgi:arylsulfatase A-like enzyme
VFIGKAVALLKSKAMYDNTLIMYSSDNGGVGPGNNYPFRGEKHSNWEGGLRTVAFVSGGFDMYTMHCTHYALYSLCR